MSHKCSKKMTFKEWWFKEPQSFDSCYMSGKDAWEASEQKTIKRVLERMSSLNVCGKGLCEPMQEFADEIRKEFNIK